MLKDYTNVGIYRKHSVVYSYLFDYIKSDELFIKNRIPLLVGTTAVAKSAIVKEVVKELQSESERDGESYGYRLIDIRSAFLDKNDIEGFTTPTRGKDNRLYAEMSPMRELIEATDQYLEYARATLDKLVKMLALKLPTDDLFRITTLSHAYHDGNKNVKGKLDNELSKYKDDTELLQLIELESVYRIKSRTPVLFFDELTRATKDVRNAFTTILNQKEFMNYTMSKARLVAATNYPVDMSEDYALIYTTDDIADIAALERFETFIVRPGDVEDQWYEWAESHIHPIVLSYLKEHSSTRLYNISVVTNELSNNKDKDPTSIVEIPFPNFRTWEFISRYISMLDKQENPSYDDFFVGSIIGFNFVKTDFDKYVKKTRPNWNYDKENWDRDLFRDALDAGVKSHVPVLLAGPTSYGKTVRVKEITEMYPEYVLVPLNLSTKDPTQVKGIPTPVDISNTVLYGSNLKLEELPDDIQCILKDTASYGVSGRTTDFMPDKYIHDKLVEARDNGKKVLIFFDEVNRCAKEVLCSVFEAVSDNRFMGIEFDDGELDVVCAANLGDSYGDITTLDPAFSARFAMVRKDDWETIDCTLFKNYMHTRGYAHEIVNFFDDMPDSQVLQMLKSVDDRTLTRVVPSMRAWDDMSEMILKSYDNNPIHGKVVFTLVQEPHSIQSADDMLDVLKNIPENWISYYDTVTLSIPGHPFMNAKTYVDMVISEIESNKDDYTSDVGLQILDSIRQIETESLLSRRKIIESKLGPMSSSGVGDKEFPIVARFFDYYNSISGTKIITLDDVEHDPSLCKDYIEMKTRSFQPEETISMCTELVNTLVDAYGDRLTEVLAQGLLSAFHDRLRYSDQILEWWSAQLDKSDKFKKLIATATDNDEAYTRTMLKRLGIPESNYDEVLNEYYHKDNKEG